MQKNVPFLCKGCFVKFGKDITGMVTMTTEAPSKAKAKSNIEYRMKQRMGLLPNTKLTFVGTITEQK